MTPEERALFVSGLKLDRDDEGRQEFFDAIGSRIGDMGRDPNLASAALVDNMRRFAAEGLRYMEVFVIGPRSSSTSMASRLPSSAASRFCASA
jgi:hypothetical protein